MLKEYCGLPSSSIVHIILLNNLHLVPTLQARLAEYPEYKFPDISLPEHVIHEPLSAQMIAIWHLVTRIDHMKSVSIRIHMKKSVATWGTCLHMMLRSYTELLQAGVSSSMH